jgi:hypothetical protein
VKWELGKALSLPIRDDKKEWILSKNLKRLTGLKQTEASSLSIKKRYHLLEIAPENPILSLRLKTERTGMKGVSAKGRKNLIRC